MSLRRQTRAVAAQLGLDENSVRNFSAATYAAARLGIANGTAAHAEVGISSFSDLQVTIRITFDDTKASALDMKRRLAPLCALVDRLSTDESPRTFTVILAASLPGYPRVDAPCGDAPGDLSQIAALAVSTDADLNEANVQLRRAVRELQSSMEEGSREVIALYAEIDVQAERLHQAEDELAAANRAKEDFLSTLSHELRTPLNAMVGWTRLLRMGKLDSPSRAHALETIERNAHLQEQLIADILDVSRTVTGRLRMELRPLELEPIVDASLDALKPAAHAKGVQLFATLSTAGTVMGDPGRLQQVVWNLLANAIKFTPAGGRVSVLLARAGPFATITITDTGEGIAPTLLPYVFDRFTQGNVSATRPHGGLGLGLSIVRHIVELHGGQVRARSDGAGRGATFSVQLPVRAIQRIGNTHYSGESPLTGVKVLVVDDDPDAREVVALALSHCGARTAAAASTREALRLLPEFRPDVLVSDIAMPGEDGYVLIERVRALGVEGVGDVPAVALTGLADPSDRHRALTAGYQQFVAKPVQADELAAVVRSLAAQRR